MEKKKEMSHFFRKPLAVQWLGFCTSTARGMGLIPGQGTKIWHATQHSKKKKNIS